MTEVAEAAAPAAAPEAAAAPPEAGEAPSTTSAPAYTDFTLPEGMGMDQAALDSALPIFQEQGFTQEQAQAAVSLRAAAMTQAEQDANTLVTGWDAASQSDSEYGGDNFDVNMGIAKSALTKFGSPELVQMLDESGMSKHPEMRRMLYRVGKLMQPDSPGGPTAAPRPAVDRVTSLYPDAATG